jgi:MFS family permease
VTRDEGAREIGAVLDELDARGPFLRRHLARMCYVWTTLALVSESTPYMFASLQKEYTLTVEDLGIFAASFQLGCVVGAIVSAMTLDALGRHRSAMLALAACGACSVLMAATQASFAVVVVLRTLQSCAWSVHVLHSVIQSR